jgi:methylase of polypeptide subunit release factors
MSELPEIEWTEAGETRRARWRSESGVAPPKRIVVADDSFKADDAYHLACEGTAILWRGDFHNARQLLQAMTRRLERKPRKQAVGLEAWNQHRLAQSQRARTLGMLLLPFEADHGVPLRRAPDVREACREARGEADGPYVSSLRELLGIVGAHEWRRKGIAVPAAGGSVHPHYGVFAPLRSEYLDLVATAPLPPACELAFDVGTGTGVLAAILARRGVARVVATDQEPRALACARENVARLGLAAQVEVTEADLFPAGRAPLIVCNPPWVPARPSSPLEYAVFDPDSRMLRGFLAGVTAHLAPQGEAWLVLSDLAERLGLRTREQLLAWIEAAGLAVVARLDRRPRHPRAADAADPLHAARAAETISLWRLAAR